MNVGRNANDSRADQANDCLSTRSEVATESSRTHLEGRRSDWRRLNCERFGKVTSSAARQSGSMLCTIM